VVCPLSEEKLSPPEWRR